MVKYQVPVPLRRLCWLMALGVDEHLAECTYSAYRRKADYERSTKAHSSRIKNLTRQLNKDLPRCHRYHQIMKLPEMQSLIQRIIASWILGNKHRVYWQGLDSVCAAFAVAFRSEPVSFACMDIFLSRLLPGIFVDDNSKVLQERFITFATISIIFRSGIISTFFHRRCYAKFICHTMVNDIICTYIPIGFIVSIMGRIIRYASTFPLPSRRWWS